MSALSVLAFDYFFLGPKCHLWIEPSSYPPSRRAVLLTTILIEAREEARRQLAAK